MQSTCEAPHALPLPAIRSILPGWVSAHVDDEALRPEVERDLLAFLVGIDDRTLEQLRANFFAGGEGWAFYPADPAGRLLTRLYMNALVAAPEVRGVDRLHRFLSEGPRRRFLICNHLSYSDTQVTDCVLVSAGLASVADRVVAIAGPKVYTDPWRRLAAISLNTRKTPQSNVVATEQDTLSPRELAAIAFAAIDHCIALADQGYIPLLYPEGARSRSGHLRPFLRASARYLAQADVQILPMAQTGSDRIFPIGASTMYRSPVRLAFGEAFEAANFPGKTGPIREAFTRLAGVLPADYQPEGDEVLV